MANDFDVVVIGGGAIGTSIFRDASMRGFSCCLVEANHIGGKTTLSSHQNLLGGMRYVMKDSEVAMECAVENQIITRIAPSLVSSRTNVFVGFDEEYAIDALAKASRLGIWHRELSDADVFKEMPDLSRELSIFVETLDRNIDAAQWCRLNCGAGVENGGVPFEKTKVTAIEPDGVSFCLQTSTSDRIRGRYVVNSSGPWIGEVARLAGFRLKLAFFQGSVLILPARSLRGIQRLGIPSDGDAYIVHNDRAWLGTTSVEICQPDMVAVREEDNAYLRRRFIDVLPSVATDPLLGAFAGVRTFILPEDERRTNQGRGFSRTISMCESEPGFLSIAGGKLTTARLAAEQVVNMIGKRMGSQKRCATASTALKSL